MKRRKRMGMYKAPGASSRGRIDPTAVPRADDLIETTQLQAHEAMQSAFESTPEKFVAFVSRMAEARSTPT
jgi:hypothetical protein